MKKTVIYIAVILAFCISVIPASVSAEEHLLQDFIVLTPGEQVQREFHISKVFDITKFYPVENFLVFTAGESETLSISLSADADLDFGEVISFALSGMAMSAGGGVTPIISSGETPFEATVEIPIEGTFGFALVGAMITEVSGSVEMPAECSIRFSLAAPGDEDDHDDDDHDDGDDHDDDGDDHDDDDHDH